MQNVPGKASSMRCWQGGLEKLLEDILKNSGFVVRVGEVVGSPGIMLL